VKGKVAAERDVIGLRELVAAILEILPVQGSKALHDEIKVLLKVNSGTRLAPLTTKLPLFDTSGATAVRTIGMNAYCRTYVHVAGASA
jgi:hypothetical protein